MAKLSGFRGKRSGGDAFVRMLQQKLAERGLYRGKVDGLDGPQTRAAMKAFGELAGVNGSTATPQFMAALNGAGPVNPPMPNMRPRPVAMEATMQAGAGPETARLDAGTIPLQVPPQDSGWGNLNAPPQSEQNQPAPPDPENTGISPQFTGEVDGGTTAMRGQFYGTQPTGDLLPQSLDQYSRATRHYWDALNESRYMDPQEFNMAHDKLVRGLNGMPEANPETGNSPLAGQDSYNTDIVNAILNRGGGGVGEPNAAQKAAATQELIRQLRERAQQSRFDESFAGY